MQEDKVVFLEGLISSWEEKQKAKEKGKDNTQLNAEFQKIARRDEKAFLLNSAKT